MSVNTREITEFFLIPYNGGEIEAEVAIEYEADGWSSELPGSIYVLDVSPGKLRCEYGANFKPKILDIGRGYIRHSRGGNSTLEYLTDEQISAVEEWLENQPMDCFEEKAFENEVNYYY